MKKLRKNIKGGVVGFLIVLPIWLLLLGLLAIEIDYTNRRSVAENDARIALRLAIREDNEASAIVKITDYLKSKGYEVSTENITFWKITYYNGSPEAEQIDPSIEQVWTKGNFIILKFNTKSRLRKGVNELCFRNGFNDEGDGNCVEIIRSSAEIEVRMFIE